MPQVDIDGANSKVSADTIRGQSGTTVTIQSGHNLVGSGSGLTALPAANLTGTLPAISGASLTGVGDKRNFIIDGDMQIQIEGDVTGIAHNKYGGVALWKVKIVAQDQLVFDLKRTADVPTFAESGWQSSFCLHADITTAETTLANDEYVSLRYIVTGSDFAALDGQEITISFWHKHTKTGTHVVVLQNSAGDRSYPFDYTQTTTNTWEKHTETLTLDTSGTWLLTEATGGLYIYFPLSCGSDRFGTVDSWEGAFDVGITGMVDNTDSASNDFKIAQFGLYLGDSAPTFVGESTATVARQVDYYVQKYSYESSSQEDTGANGRCNNTTGANYNFTYRNKTRIIPAVTFTAAATWSNTGPNGAVNLNSISATAIGFNSCSIQGGTASSWTDESIANLVRDGTDTTNILLDARH